MEDERNYKVTFKLTNNGREFLYFFQGVTEHTSFYEFWNIKNFTNEVIYENRIKIPKKCIVNLEIL